MENLQVILERMYTLLVRYGMKFVTAVLVLVVGLIVIKWITKALVRMMKK